MIVFFFLFPILGSCAPDPTEVHRRSWSARVQATPPAVSVAVACVWWLIERGRVEPYSQRYGPRPTELARDRHPRFARACVFRANAIQIQMHSVRAQRSRGVRLHFGAQGCWVKHGPCRVAVIDGCMRARASHISCPSRRDKWVNHGRCKPSARGRETVGEAGGGWKAGMC
jgi:hypothetical protein